MRELAELLERTGGLSLDDLHTILEALPIPLSWARMPSGSIRFVNQSFTRTFGYVLGDFANVEDWIAHAYPNEQDRERGLTFWRGIWQTGGQGRLVVDPFEVQIRCADGSLKTVENRGILLYDIGVSIATFNDITERKAAEDTLRRFASEDPLTGLANRRGLEARWQERMGEGGSGLTAVIVLDLDRFKTINDSYGHQTGDETLIRVAACLRQNVREQDLVCRMGGDEFAVLLCGLEDIAEAEAMCARLSRALNQPMPAGGLTLFTGASIGMSLFPQDGDTLQTLLRCADEALYRCKAQKPGGWAWHKPPKAA